ncbi:UNVERIFIED_CONTAM: hypothetical protein RMT77_019426 [Armadillidium vulgare]
MILFTVLFFFIWSISDIRGLTYYEYYTPPGENITSGLVAEGVDFTLNGKAIKIFSGSFHYFRVHPSHWRDIFKKHRAAGLNAIQTYMPWNLHNPAKGKFDFGTGDEALSPFLDVRTFVQMAQEEDLFVLLRPGPYICAEWEFGGLPSWLLADYTMQFRNMYQGYVDAVDAFIQNVGEQLSDLTFNKGGPIIAVQVENEYGHFGYRDEPRDKKYLRHVYDTLKSSGFYDGTLFYTSDSPSETYDWGSLNPEVLMTGNFQYRVAENLDILKELQPNRPLLVAEFWTGWYDYWFKPEHSTRDPNEINDALIRILEYNSSVNFYMFIGGTSFGFTSGGNIIDEWPHYLPIVSSYDYDAPLTEAGEYTEKYQIIKQTIEQYNPLNGTVENPSPPEDRAKKAYGNYSIDSTINLFNLTSQVPRQDTVQIIRDEPLPSMEEFYFLNNGSGQAFGFAFFRTRVNLPAGNSTLLIRGHVRDVLQVLVNGVVVTKPYSHVEDVNGFGFWNGRDETLEFSTSGGETEIGFLIENLSRVNFGKPHYYKQKKGLWEGNIYVNLEKITTWEITPLEFKKSFVNSLQGWETYTEPYQTPAAYRVSVPIDEEPVDTFLDMTDWNKGVVFVNGFNLGRYWKVGPLHSLYVPGPLLNQGDNEFIVFEQYEPSTQLVFTDHLILG